MIFRLLKRKDEFHKFVESIIGTSTNQIELYRLAFTHSSTNKECNERLEFLGDSIIGSSVSMFLYQNLPNEREGSLTNTKCKIVSRENLNRVALYLGIANWIESKPNVPISGNALGNTFEAMMGALYVDKGSKYTEKQIIKLLQINLNQIEEKVISHKSELIEFCQRWKLDYTFVVTDVGTQKAPYYRATLSLSDVDVAEGFGYSKKKAEESASQKYMTNIAKTYN